MPQGPLRCRGGPSAAEAARPLLCGAFVATRPLPLPTGRLPGRAPLRPLLGGLPLPALPLLPASVLRPSGWRGCFLLRSRRRPHHCPPRSQRTLAAPGCWPPSGTLLADASAGFMTLQSVGRCLSTCCVPCLRGPGSNRGTEGQRGRGPSCPLPALKGRSRGALSGPALAPGACAWCLGWRGAPRRPSGALQPPPGRHRRRRSRGGPVMGGRPGTWLPAQLPQSPEATFHGFSKYVFSTFSVV